VSSGWLDLDWHFEHLELVHLIWAAVAIVGGLAWLELRNRDVLGGFLSPAMQRHLSVRPSAGRIAARLALILAARVCGVLALMRPQGEGTVAVASGATAADVVFVLDVSRSMLAEDAAPNRLARAKAEIGQMVERLEGHRMGLVVYAGRAVLMCPLTPDRSYFELVLSAVTTDSAGRGGTRMGDAVRTALRAFPREPGGKVLVLVTDGEDHESNPAQAAEAAKRAGVHIVAVGLGSEAGSEIKITDPRTGAKTTLMHDGAPVIVKLDGNTLREMAIATEGAYIPAGTAALDLDSIIDSHVQPIIREAATETMRRIPVERYPYLVLACLAFLLAALWTGAGLERPEGRP
jgi:Ca-activated chloride channel family protein